MQANNIINPIKRSYSPDVLGDGFEQLTLAFSNDYEGEVKATLVRKQSEKQTPKAVLYIHGFNDYFFQAQMANRFNAEGYNFYALDLRKYGRSYMPHQKLNNVRSLMEYDEDITEALHHIKAEKNEEVILIGHSTGGLTVTYYAGRHLNSDLFHGVICNSPFYEFNLSVLERKIGAPILSFLSRYYPNQTISSGFSRLYGYSLHHDKYGEWNYSLVWKPHDIPDVTLSFIAAIHQAQNLVQNTITLNVPLLVLYSDKTISDKKWSDRFMTGDSVLNVNHIKHYANKIKGDVSTCEIKNGMHDLVLSQKTVREETYKRVFDWLDQHVNQESYQSEALASG
ncbi:alpha/beta hydrolase [Bizionia paragorgiae]|uniref:Lysophospholipase, alpha-beta hydrolase superfamily n=1 Tax=Bizionia paragorgiae TaxID=283786 RepID=A0A1H4C5G2_BIZPA|nr:alpha/beta hydrolase [Bizionia paragorgiae]SEA55577.1 Lysophospholipase, alpha-beta hydrolase superfamily [Bizionia paragorgiae]